MFLFLFFSFLHFALVINIQREKEGEKKKQTNNSSKYEDKTVFLRHVAVFENTEALSQLKLFVASLLGPQNCTRTQMLCCTYISQVIPQHTLMR